MESVISLRNVTKEYDLDGDAPITPVHEVSLDVRRGEFVIVVGRSGSGKTTLLNLMAGLVKPTSGEVLIGDVNPHRLRDADVSRLRNRKLGFVFQFPSLLPSLTAAQNVALPAFFGGSDGKGAYDRAGKLLDDVGLSARANSYPRQLSAGEQRRVVIARSLINHPDILLADEPTSDLDEQTEREVMSLLKDIHSKGTTIMMVTHGLDLLNYGTRTLRMDKGHLRELAAEAQGV